MSDTEPVDHIRAPWTSRWCLETTSGSARDVLDADGALVARLDSPLDEREDKARAALIAAAPELFEAAETLCDQRARTCDVADPEVIKAWQALLTAVSKARGGA